MIPNERHSLDNLIESMICFRRWIEPHNYTRPNSIVNNPYSFFSREHKKYTNNINQGITLNYSHNGDCPVCLDDTRLCQLPKCTHCVCNSCWKNWENIGNVSCPVCRQEQI